MNPMQIIQMIKGKGSVEQVARQMAQNSNNPIVNNLIKQIDNGNQEEVNKICNNVMQESGMRSSLEQFASMLGINKK